MAKVYLELFVERYRVTREGKILVKARRVDIIRRMGNNIFPARMKEILEKNKLQLIDLFYWEESDEGEDYWISIYRALQSGDVQFLEGCY